MWGYHELGHAFESHAPIVFFIFYLENILRSNLNFSTSYGRLADLESIKGYYWWDFYGLEKKFH